MNENINQEIVSELRRIRAIALGVLGLLLLLMVLTVLGALFSPGSLLASSADSWGSVDAAMMKQDFPKALTQAKALVAGQPGYWYGQAYLGAIYLAMGDVTNAHTHYSRAYELFPDADTEKSLAAVSKRMTDPKPMKLLSR